jgi:NTP pyrophosphatase (non-canonical NTP hydrolase)
MDMGELTGCMDYMRNDAIRTINRLLVENQSLREALDMYGGDDGITAVCEERDRLADENRALKAELRVNLGNKYWMNICRMNARQEAKGMEKYGEPLEENTTLTTTQRIEHAQEEAIDLLKYLEHLKQVAEDGITANDYQRACLRTATSDKAEWLENAIYGIIGEAGEIVDLVKKHKWQGHELDVHEVALELGDLFWYGSLLASAIGYELGTVMQMNEEKLRERYPEGFSKDRSINRKENAE